MRSGPRRAPIGKFLFAKLPLLEKIAGAVIIVFGLHTMGVFRIATLDTEKRVQTQRKPAGPLGAVLVGIAFAFGWTPCIGPILGGILVVAGSKETVSEGVMLLAVYSLGLGIPFLLTSLAIDRFFAVTATHPQALPRHRARLGWPARRGRPADLHAPAHRHHAVS